MTAGFIGTGNMGLPLASLILDQEKNMSVFDINPEATKTLADKQARIAKSPMEVASQADVVFACMPSVASFEAVVEGADGVVHGSEIKTFVNLGTMGTEAVGEVERQLAEKGIEMLDCPITGGTQRAWAKEIAAIASGPKAVFDRVEPLISAFAGEIFYIGDQVGQAQVVKMINNMMSLTNLASCIEGVVLGAKAGIDVEKLLSVINSGSGQNSASLTKVPRHVLNRKFDLGGPMYISQKDVTLWRQEAERLGATQWVGNTVHQLVMQAGALGYGPGDVTEIAKVIEQMSDIEIPKTRD
jgi:3-hydroxyisobutyrate dehydrogenase-like beta-hydroxyacid dehydrogenase